MTIFFCLDIDMQLGIESMKIENSTYYKVNKHI